MHFSLYACMHIIMHASMHISVPGWPYIALHSPNAGQCRISESVCIPLMCGARQHHPSAERCEANLMRMERKKWIQHINTWSTHTETHSRGGSEVCSLCVCALWVLIKRCTGPLENSYTHMHRGPPVNLQPFHGCSGPCELSSLSLHHACINIHHTSNNFLCPLHVHKSSICRSSTPWQLKSGCFCWMHSKHQCTSTRIHCESSETPNA